MPVELGRRPRCGAGRGARPESGRGASFAWGRQTHVGVLDASAADGEAATMPFGRESRKIKFGSKPHLLVGTALGTLATFVAFFEHYRTLGDNSGKKLTATFACLRLDATRAARLADTRVAVCRASGRGMGLVWHPLRWTLRSRL